jgi:hypothetical protein
MDTYKVLSNFRDSVNGQKLHKEGEEAKFTKDRGAYLVEKGVVEKVADAAPTDDVPADQDAAKEPGAAETVADAAPTKEEKFIKPKSGK